MISRSLAGLGAAALLLMSACSSATPAGSPSPAATHLAYRDGGRTVAVALGSDVEVSLTGRYWAFAAPTPAGVLRGSPPVVRSSSSGRFIPGSGAGRVVARFHAVTRGRAVITATRTSCGEARPCAPGQRSYQVVIVVR